MHEKALAYSDEVAEEEYAYGEEGEEIKWNNRSDFLETNVDCFLRS